MRSSGERWIPDEAFGCTVFAATLGAAHLQQIHPEALCNLIGHAHIADNGQVPIGEPLDRYPSSSSASDLE